MFIIAILKIILLLRKNTTRESVVFDLIQCENFELIEIFPDLFLKTNSIFFRGVIKISQEITYFQINTTRLN